ncbi:hypothetical protein [Sinomicrobium sp. M5D2P9]
MAVLKKKYRKVKASTLMETLVATVLIVVIFMVTSLVLNNLFSGSVSQDTRKIENRLRVLGYMVQRNKIELPYSEDFGEWNISVLAEARSGMYGVSPSAVSGYREVVVEAKQKNTDKKIVQKIICRNEPRQR